MVTEWGVTASGSSGEQWSGGWRRTADLSRLNVVSLGRRDRDPELQPAGTDIADDSELIGFVRRGDRAAYGRLYERHRVAALRCARRLCRCSATAEDVVSEAFVKVLEALLAGGGPDAGFRAYLLTAVRRLAYTAMSRNGKLDLVADIAAVGDISPGVHRAGADGVVMARLDQAMASRAFGRLPSRWQWVLVRTAIDGQRPAQLAPGLGLSSNSVAALAWRARRALRLEYLRAHVAEAAVDDRCRSSAEDLAARVRGRLPQHRVARIDAHLARCDRCAARLGELTEISSRLPA